MDTSYADYCSCGRPKYKKAKRCATCHAAKPREDNAGLYNNCPQCNNPKRKTAKLCQACRLSREIGEPIRQNRNWWGDVPDYSNVGPAFAALAAGFVCGEGCIRLDKSFASNIKIGLHSDDAETLWVMRDVFGGSVNYGRSRPIAYWVLNGLGKIGAFLRLILPHARLLKSLKVRDMEIMLEYVEWRMSIGRAWGRNKPLSPEHCAIRKEFYERLRAVKVRGQ